MLIVEVNLTGPIKKQQKNPQKNPRKKQTNKQNKTK